MAVEAFARRLGDRISGRQRITSEVPDFRVAAVLVPLVVRAGELHLVFTLRPEGLPTHPGQISFPGGKVDPGDPDRIATALREAEEELGIASDRVVVLGMLDDVLTPSGFVITPVVGLIAADVPLRPSEHEVAEAFELSVSALRAPGVLQDMGEVERAGRMYRLMAFQLAGRNIWGATARVLAQLFEVSGDLLDPSQELADA